MLFLQMGIFAFILFAISEICTVAEKPVVARPLFFIGVTLLGVSSCAITAKRVVQVARQAATQAESGGILIGSLEIGRMIFFGILALLCFGLLIYSLFFAIPFTKTYIDSDVKQKKVCRDGMYALCRHPGVLWFIGVYLFLWLSLGGELLFAQFVIYSALNVLYIIIQDNWSFLKCFDDYAEYKKETPFLIPNRKSMMRGVDTFKRSKDISKHRSKRGL